MAEQYCVGKTWFQLDEAEKKERTEKLCDAYEKLGFPDWLANPKAERQLVNVLMNRQQVKQEIFEINGKTSEDLQDDVD